MEVKYMKIIIAVFFLTLFFVPGYGSFETSGTTSGEFLKITSSARSAALGGAYTALDDFNNMSINPACITHGEKFNIGLNTIALFQDVTYLNLNSTYKNKHDGFGLGVIWLNSGKIPLTGNSYASSEAIRMNNYAISFGYSRELGSLLGLKFSKDLSVGVQWEYFHESFADLYKIQGSVFDFGFYYMTPIPKLNIGLSVLNVKLFSSEISATPMSIKIGSKYDFSYFKLNKTADDFSFLVDFEKINSMNVNIMAGLETRFQDIFFFRVGYKFLHDTGGLSLGAGVKMSDFQIDYSFSPHLDLGQNQHLSITYSFDPPKRVRKIYSDKNELNASPQCFSLVNKEEIKFTVKKISKIDTDEWKFSIYSGDKLLYLKDGKGKVPTKILWDGKNNKGDYLSFGEYKCVFEAFDKNSFKKLLYETPIYVSGNIPEVSLEVDKESFSPDDDGVDDTIKFLIDIKNNSPIENWQISIMDNNSKVVHNISGTGMPPSEIQWDGKDEADEVIPQNSIYKYSILTKDIYGHKNTFSSDGFIKTDLYLNKMDNEGFMINLEGVKFALGKFTIRPASYKMLNAVSLILLKESMIDKKVRVEGHTDSVGNMEKNMLLSKNRAKKVMEYLIKKGLDAERLSYEGIGPKRPVASNDTKEGRQKNRRVELIIEEKE